MRLIPRLLAVALMLGAMFFLIQHLKDLQAQGEVEMSSLVAYYVGIMGLGAATALVTCISLLPLLGEFAGNFLFSPNIQIERSPHADALAKVAAGDFEAAVEEYKSVVDDNPKDTHAINEVVRLYCEKLGQPEPASDFLLEVLSYDDWTPEERAFLSERMVDVCWDHQRDAVRARAILMKIAEDMPETREAANALHRLQAIERKIEEETYLAAQAAAQGDAETSAEGESAEPQEGAVAANPPDKTEGLKSIFE